MLITYNEEINGIRYTFSSEEVLRPFAEPLLEAVEHIPTSRIKDGFRIRAGFSTFLLSEHNGGFDIAAPDYKDDPLTVLTTDLTLALQVQHRQVMLLYKYGIVGKAIHFYDKIAAAKGAVDYSNLITLQRFEELGGSGWVIEEYNLNEKGEAVPVEAKEYETIFAYELITRRPEVIDVLSLPDGFLVVFNGDDIIDIIDDTGESLMTHK